MHFYQGCAMSFEMRYHEAAASNYGGELAHFISFHVIPYCAWVNSKPTPTPPSTSLYQPRGRRFGGADFGDLSLFVLFPLEEGGVRSLGFRGHGSARRAGGQGRARPAAVASSSGRVGPQRLRSPGARHLQLLRPPGAQPAAAAPCGNRGHQLWRPGGAAARSSSALRARGPQRLRPPGRAASSGCALRTPRPNAPVGTETERPETQCAPRRIAALFLNAYAARP